MFYCFVCRLNILYFNEDSGDALFNYIEIGIVYIGVLIVNIDIDILIRLLSWHSKFEKRKELKKELNEELMLVVWHPKKWSDWCVSEDKKMEIDSIFTEEL